MVNNIYSFNFHIYIRNVYRQLDTVSKAVTVHGQTVTWLSVWNDPVSDHPCGH